jgi:hypothetical protein
LKMRIPFFFSLFLSSSLTVAGYLIMVHVMKKIQ